MDENKNSDPSLKGWIELIDYTERVSFLSYQTFVNMGFQKYIEPTKMFALTRTYSMQKLLVIKTRSSYEIFKIDMSIPEAQYGSKLRRKDVWEFAKVVIKLYDSSILLYSNYRIE